MITNEKRDFDVDIFFSNLWTDKRGSHGFLRDWEHDCYIFREILMGANITVHICGGMISVKLR